MQPKTFGDKELMAFVRGKESRRTLDGVQKFSVLDGRRLIRYDAVRTASPQYEFGNKLVNIIERATSNK